MRWICKDDIEECLTDSWRKSAQKALDEINAATTSNERKAILKKTTSTKVWRDFYEILPANLKKKCWYCEAEETRSDTPVDHFRPKNKVEEEQGHDEGYWWLAFNWDNYRCACTFCNSRRVFEDTEGGKACCFPLVDPAKRAFSPSDDINQEQPDLLDPFNPDDEKLLWFDNDGLPEPVPNANAAQKQKVENSVRIFHLHEKRIVQKRNKIRIDVNKAVTKIKQAETDGDTAALSEAKSTLKKMVRDSEMLSRTAIVYLRAHRDVAAVKDILNLD